MTARKELFSVQVITDDDCGMYRIGEIDTDPQDAVREYVRSNGEYGYQEMLQLGARILEVAQVSIRDHRMSQQMGAMSETCGS